MNLKGSQEAGHLYDFCFTPLPWVPVLNSLSNGTCQSNKPFPHQVAFDHGVYRSNNNNNKFRIEHSKNSKSIYRVDAHPFISLIGSIICERLCLQLIEQSLKRDWFKRTLTSAVDSTTDRFPTWWHCWEWCSPLGGSGSLSWRKPQLFPDPFPFFSLPGSCHEVRNWGSPNAWPHCGP